MIQTCLLECGGWFAHHVCQYLHFSLGQLVADGHCYNYRDRSQFACILFFAVFLQDVQIEQNNSRGRGWIRDLDLCLPSF